MKDCKLSNGLKMNILPHFYYEFVYQATQFYHIHKLIYLIDHC
jgi:hypothetical protein